MKDGLFNPHRIELPEHLLLIPQFWDKSYYKKLKEKSDGCVDFFHSKLLLFEKYSILTGFLGYPHILTLLEFIRDVRGKEIFFLGTAGSLNPAIDSPIALSVVEINSTEILDHFGPQLSYSLTPFDPPEMAVRPVTGVTVDILQRETAPWLKEQVKKGIDIVEMEIFPLRVYLEKSFTAVVVSSDRLTENGIMVFKDKKRLEKEFVKTFEAIINSIHSNLSF